jgi:hypothetical protein
MASPKIIEKAFSTSNIVRKFEDRHRDAMLEVILAWADLDGAMSILLTNILGIRLVEGAGIVGKMKTSSKFHEIFKIIRDIPSGADAAKIIKRQKKTYEELSFFRNRIAHAKCVGIRKDDPDFVVFAAFEKHNDDDLVVDAIPIQEMDRAASWARGMSAMALNLADNIENRSV